MHLKHPNKQCFVCCVFKQENKAKGEDASRAILTEKDVLEIRNSGLTIIKLAEKYEVSSSAISSVLRGVNWKHIGGPRQRRFLEKDEVRAIRHASSKGLTGRELALDYGVSEGTISLIINRKIWKHV